MLGVWGDTEKSAIKSQLKKTFIFIYLFLYLFALFLYTWLFPSSFVHFFIALRLYALHPLLGKGKGLPSSVHFFTYLFICIVSVHLITCTRCTRCILLIPCFVRFNIVETFA